MPQRVDDKGNMEKAVAGGEDRISALPDELLQCMMSFLLSRDAVRTCVLAKRWRTLWKSVPALHIDDPESYNGATGSSTFVDELIRLRDPTPLNVCIITSNCKEMVDDDSFWDDEVFNRMAPWLQYVLSCQVQELRVHFPLRVTNMTFISPHLKRLEFYNMRFEGSSLDFSSCQVLEELRMDLWDLSADISSQSLKYLYINALFFDYGARTNIFAPNLVCFQLAVYGGLTPLLNTMPSLEAAYIILGEACKDYYCCRNVSCDGCRGRKYRDRSAFLKGLSGATDLEVTISSRATVIFRNNFEWGHMFSKLKTLLLSEWCVVDDFVGLVYFLQHAPLLEKLTLQLDFGTRKKQHVTKTDESYNSSVPSIISKHLKVVKIICDTKEDARFHHILEILHTHGVPSEQIDIQ